MDLHEFTPITRVKSCRNGGLMYNIHDQRIGQALEIYGEYAQLELNLLGQLTKPGNVVVEAGANIGSHTLFMARRVGPMGSVLAFEAQRMLYLELCANMALNGVTNVYPFQMALADQPGSMVMDVPDYTKDGDFGAVTQSYDNTGEKVRQATLDSFNLAACDILLVDVFGMEPNVLAGAATTIQSYRPRIYVDAFVDYSRKRTAALLEDMDYDIFWHRPAMFNPRNFTGEQENIFGDEQSQKFLALPKGHGLTLKNMEKVTSSNL